MSSLINMHSAISIAELGGIVHEAFAQLLKISVVSLLRELEGLRSCNRDLPHTIQQA